VVDEEPVRVAPRVKWRFKADLGNLSCAPAVYGGVAYFGDGPPLYIVSYYGPRFKKYKLYAVDADSGKRLWTFDTQGAVTTTPLVVEDTLYFGTDEGVFYAVDRASGEERWRYRAHFDITSAPLLVGGVVFFGGSGTNICALDISDGTLVWKFGAGDGSEGKEAMVLGPLATDGERIYFSANGTYLYALDMASGKEEWKRAAPLSLKLWGSYGPLWSAPVVANDMVYYIEDTNRLRWCSRNGTDMGEYLTELTLEQDGVVYHADNEIAPYLAVTEEMLYFTTHHGGVLAVDARQGDDIWQFKVDSLLGWPTIARDVIYVASVADDHLYAINKDSGEQLWVYDIEGLKEPTIVVEDGVIYVRAGSGVLCALEEGQPDGGAEGSTSGNTSAV